jgi:hypothetical protein
MPARPLSLEERLAARGVSRRQFLKFCAAMSATLALPATFTPRIAKALNTGRNVYRLSGWSFRTVLAIPNPFCAPIRPAWPTLC